MALEVNKFILEGEEIEFSDSKAREDIDTLDAKVDRNYNTLDDKIDNEATRLDGRVDTVNNRVTSEATRLDGRVDTVNGRVTSEATRLDGRIDTVNDRVTSEASRLDGKINTQGVPAGGTTSQILAKTSNNDYATQWVNPPTPGPGGAEIDDSVIALDKTWSSSKINNINGSGSGRANSLAFREEITEITSEMWQDIYTGNFKKVHVGMRYTAPSGRTYWFAHADYNYGMGGTEQDRHTMLVIEDDITITSPHHSTNTTEGGAVASDIYTTVLPAHQGELEADFGAEHIIPQSIYLTNAVTNGVASGGAWTSLYSSILTEKQIFDNYIRYTDGANYYINFLVRERQLALFANMPETIIAHEAGTTNRMNYWTDTVETASDFGFASNSGNVRLNIASVVYGVRRAFFIG